jgi:GAF domain-containing protein
VTDQQDRVVAHEHRDAFDELAKVVLSEHSVESIMTKISELGKRVIPGASEVSVTLVRADSAVTVASTGELASDLDERQYERGFGPCLAACEANEVVHIPVMAAETRFADFARKAVERGAGSSLTMPMPVQTPVTAALNIYSRDVDAFDGDAVEIGRTLASYAGVALANMTLHESTQQLAQQMEAAMRSRAVIEQAKGIVMARDVCTSDVAFQHLVDVSQRTNQKLRAVAEALVAEIAGAPRDPAGGAA